MNNTIFIACSAIIFRILYIGHQWFNRQSLVLTVHAQGLSEKSDSESGAGKADASGIQGKDRHRKTNR